MELNNYKNYKYINNTHDPSRLPGFVGGTPAPALDANANYMDLFTIGTTKAKPAVANTNVRTPINQNVNPNPVKQQGPFTLLGITENSGSGYNGSSKDTAKNESDIGGAITAAPDLFKNMYSSWSNYDDVGELIASANTTQMYKNGIGYLTRLLTTAKDGKLPGYREGTATNIIGSTASGAQIGGSIVPGWGHVIGGAVGLVGSAIGEIYSSNKQKENERNARSWLGIQNTAAEDDAYSTYLSLYNAKKYGDVRDQLLHSFACGKLPKYDLGKVSTANGPALGEATARVSNGEVIANKFTGSMYRVPGMKNNKDGKLASLSDSDTVITNKYGLSDYAWRTGDIEGAEQIMKLVGNPTYKNGKLPGHAEGWMGNAFPALVGGIAGLGQYLYAKNNKPYYPNTYVANPYENAGLSTLAGLRVNPYPIMNLLRSAEARTNRAIDIAGGLSGALRTAARLANLNTTQSNIANMLSNIQQQNNAYRANYAQAAINAGQASRQARIQANQWDLDMYAKAHAARNRGMQTGIANMLAQIQQYQANEFKRRLLNHIVGLYEDDLKQKQQYMGWLSNLPTSRITGLGFDNTRIDPMKLLFYYDDKTRLYVPYNS